MTPKKNIDILIFQVFGCWYLYFKNGYLKFISNKAKIILLNFMTFNFCELYKVS